MKKPLIKIIHGTRWLSTGVFDKYQLIKRVKSHEFFGKTYYDYIEVDSFSNANYVKIYGRLYKKERFEVIN